MESVQCNLQTLRRAALCSICKVGSRSGGVQVSHTSTVSKCPFSAAYIRAVQCSLFCPSIGAPQARRTYFAFEICVLGSEANLRTMLESHSVPDILIGRNLDNLTFTASNRPRLAAFIRGVYWFICSESAWAPLARSP